MARPDPSGDESSNPWRGLPTTFSAGTFFRTDVRSESDPDGCTLCEARSATACAVASLAFGLLFVIAGLASDLEGAWRVFWCLCIGVTIGAGTARLATCRRVRLPTGGAHAVFEWGLRFRPRRLAMPRALLVAAIARGKHGGNLSFAAAPEGHRVVVGAFRTGGVPTELRRVPGLAVEDGSLRRLVLEDGRAFHYTRLPVRSGNMPGMLTTLSFPRGDVAVIRPSRWVTLPLQALMALCLFVGFPYAAKLAGEGALFPAIAVGATAAVLLPALGLYLQLQALTVLLDRSQQSLVVRRGMWPPRQTREYALRDVVGLQLCRYWLDAGEGDKPFAIVELNALLTQPQGERLHLLGHAEALRVREDARRLADFLQVPVKDATLDG